MVDVDEDLVAGVTHDARRGRAERDPVADAADLDQHLAGGVALEKSAAERADHRRPASGTWARWHSATAAASAASAGRGGEGSRSRVWIIFCTWSFGAAP